VTATLLLAAALAIIGVPALSLAPGLGERLVEGFQRVQAYLVATPELPSFLANLPFVSETLAELWKALADPASAFQTFIQPYSSELRRALVEVARAFAEGIFQLLVALAVATMFWLRGDTLAIAVKDVAERLGGSAAGDALHTAADSVRGIAYGIVGTAALQGLAMGIGLFIAGVPGAGLLGFLTMVIALSQFGILLVVIWGGAAWWLFSIGSPGWSIFIVVWGLLVSTVDNFIRPWLVSFGAPLPITLIVLGVFGGFLAFGFLGLFIGPTLLGVFFSLLQGWRALPKPVGLLGVPEDDADGPGRA
jgi:predicted PurR-regulated permease PerM